MQTHPSLFYKVNCHFLIGRGRLYKFFSSRASKQLGYQGLQIILQTMEMIHPVPQKAIELQNRTQTSNSDKRIILKIFLLEHEHHDVKSCYIPFSFPTFVTFRIKRFHIGNCYITLIEIILYTIHFL